MKVLTRLCECAGLSETPLLVYAHEMAQLPISSLIKELQNPIPKRRTLNANRLLGYVKPPRFEKNDPPQKIHFHQNANMLEQTK